MVYKEEYYTNLLSFLPKIKKILGISYGGSGSHVLLEENNGYEFSRSGRQILGNIQLRDPYDNLILEVLKKEITRSETLQDSSTLSALITCELVLKSLKYLTAGTNPEKLYQGMKVYLKELDQYLIKLSTSHTSVDFDKLVLGLAKGEKQAAELLLQAFKVPDDNLYVRVLETDQRESFVREEKGCVFKSDRIGNRYENYHYRTVERPLLFVFDQRLDHQNQLKRISRKALSIAVHTAIQLLNVDLVINKQK